MRLAISGRCPVLLSAQYMQTCHLCDIPDLFTTFSPGLPSQPSFQPSKDIQNEDQEKACLYDGLRETFLLAAERLEPDTRKYVQNTVEQFNRDFQPIVASMKYQDLKQEDVKLIDNIPFILTYTEDACLVTTRPIFSACGSYHWSAFGPGGSSQCTHAVGFPHPSWTS